VTDGSGGETRNLCRFLVSGINGKKGTMGFFSGADSWFLESMVKKAQWDFSHFISLDLETKGIKHKIIRVPQK
jgi:hypothetical protein